MHNMATLCIRLQPLWLSYKIQKKRAAHVPDINKQINKSVNKRKKEKRKIPKMGDFGAYNEGARGLNVADTRVPRRRTPPRPHPPFSSSAGPTETISNYRFSSRPTKNALRRSSVQHPSPVAVAVVVPLRGHARVRERGREGEGVTVFPSARNTLVPALLHSPSPLAIAISHHFPFPFAIHFSGCLHLRSRGDRGGASRWCLREERSREPRP
jgi:hypothetical protein